MIFDGKTFATARRGELLKECAKYGALSLGVVMGENDPVTSSFVRVKERNAAMLGVTLVRYGIPEGASTEEVQALVGKASQESGLIVQLPLSEGVDVERVLSSIPVEKDVDALSRVASEKIQSGNIEILPPVAAAIHSIIEKEQISVSGEKAVVVGKGKLVGAPVAELLRHLGAEVVSLDRSDDIALHTKNASIVVLGAGAPHFLKPDMVSEGVVIFDAGTSESNGVVVGDADPSIAEKASFFTPTPGGIGPVAVVEIFGNLLKLQNIKEGKSENRDVLIGKLASQFHEKQQKERREEGVTTRVKVKIRITDENGVQKEDWVNENKVPAEAEIVKKEDILNTGYTDLDPMWQEENRLAAEVVVDLLHKSTEEGRKLDDVFVEEASAVVHEKWLERNGKFAPDEQRKPYPELSEEEKDKDRDQVKMGMAL